MQSDNINELAKALVGAQAEFSAVPKGSVNPFFKSKYAALPDVVATAGPVLAKHGLAVSQFIGSDELITYLLHESGQFIAHTMTLHIIKDDPQAQGSAVTYARRYSYMACLGLVADDDDDANLATRPKAAAKPVLPDTHQMLKALLQKSHPDAADRKFYLEAKARRTLGGISDLTTDEVNSIITELQGA